MLQHRMGRRMGRGQEIAVRGPLQSQLEERADTQQFGGADLRT